MNSEARKVNWVFWIWVTVNAQLVFGSYFALKIVEAIREIPQ